MRKLSLALNSLSEIEPFYLYQLKICANMKVRPF